MSRKYSRRCASISTEIDVDIDLEDFEDEPLIEELRARGYIVSQGSALDVDIESAYMAIRSRNDIPEAAREFILAAANRVS